MCVLFTVIYHVRGFRISIPHVIKVQCTLGLRKKNYLNHTLVLVPLENPLVTVFFMTNHNYYIFHKWNKLYFKVFSVSLMNEADLFLFLKFVILSHIAIRWFYYLSYHFVLINTFADIWSHSSLFAFFFYFFYVDRKDELKMERWREAIQGSSLNPLKSLIKKF